MASKNYRVVQYTIKTDDGSYTTQTVKDRLSPTKAHTLADKMSEKHLNYEPGASTIISFRAEPTS